MGTRGVSAQAEAEGYRNDSRAAQSVYLQAATLGLGTVAVGAFEDDQVARIAGLRPGEEPLPLLPVGRE